MFPSLNAPSANPTVHNNIKIILSHPQLDSMKNQSAAATLVCQIALGAHAHIQPQVSTTLTIQCPQLTVDVQQITKLDVQTVIGQENIVLRQTLCSRLRQLFCGCLPRKTEDRVPLARDVQPL